MKTILVPTDFSEISKNATEYACEIAKLMQAKIVLFHTYHLPLVTTDAMIMAPASDELEQYAVKGLLKLKKEIEKKHGKSLQIEYHAILGFAVDEITLYAKEHRIDLIVMGMQGAGYLSEKLLGSITTALIKEANCPVFAIDQRVKFKVPKKIVLACDYLETKNKTILQPLKQIVNLFKSHLYVLNVIDEFAFAPSIPDAVSDLASLEDSLSGVDHSLHYLRDKNVVDGINTFISERNMDMVVMIPRKHSILKSIFQEPNTKRMAFHTNIPLLAIH
ncbi:MAG: universal stress protein [Bacteroidetes bacterium]|nr:universal stress protein [Bacteroidota bacterium]